MIIGVIHRCTYSHNGGDNNHENASNSRDDSSDGIANRRYDSTLYDNVQLAFIL